MIVLCLCIDFAEKNNRNIDFEQLIAGWFPLFLDEIYVKLRTFSLMTLKVVFSGVDFVKVLSFVL